MTTEFLVDGMSCGHCVNVVTEAIHALDPAAGVDVDLGNKHVRIHSDVDRFLLSQALLQAGYAPRLVDIGATDQSL
jgi:copper chaperone